MRPTYCDEATVRRRQGREEGAFTLLELVIVAFVLLMIGMFAVTRLQADAADLRGSVAGGQIELEGLASIQTAASMEDRPVQSVTLDRTPTPGNLLIAVAGSRAHAPYPAPAPSGEGWREVQAFGTGDHGGNKTVAVWAKQAQEDEPVVISWDSGQHGALVVHELSVGELSSVSIATDATVEAPLRLGPTAGVRGPGLAIVVAMVRGDTTVDWTGPEGVEEIAGGTGVGVVTLSTGWKFVEDASVQQVFEADGWISAEGDAGAGAAGIVVIFQP